MVIAANAWAHRLVEPYKEKVKAALVRLRQDAARVLASAAGAAASAAPFSICAGASSPAPEAACPATAAARFASTGPSARRVSWSNALTVARTIFSDGTLTEQPDHPDNSVLRMGRTGAAGHRVGGFHLHHLARRFHLACETYHGGGAAVVQAPLIDAPPAPGGYVQRRVIHPDFVLGVPAGA